MQNIFQIIFILLQVVKSKEISALQIMVNEVLHRIAEIWSLIKFHSELDKVTISFMT